VNLYNYITPQENETFTTLLKHKNIIINRIVSSEQVQDKEYIQEEDEWFVLLEGEATLLIDREKKVLTKGDTLFIKAKTPHRVVQTSHETLWLTVHIFN